MRLTDRLSLVTLWMVHGDDAGPVRHGVILRRDEQSQQDHLFNWSARASLTVDPGLEAVAGWLVDDGGWTVDREPPEPPHGLVVRDDRSTLSVATLGAARERFGAEPEGLRLAEATTEYGARAVAFAVLAPRRR